MKQLLLSVFVLISVAALGRQPGPSEVKALEKQQTSLSFLENKGQITDQYYKARPDVDYKLSAGGVSMFVGDGQLHYQWNKADQVEPDPSKFATPEDFDKAMTARKVHTYRMDVTLLGANKQAKVITENKQAYFEQYYLPGCESGATASTFGKITYKDIYPNIDWVLYTQDNKLKYDFVIRPGGDPGDIKLRYEGATGLQLKNGALVATTPLGSITEQAPYSYIANTKEQVSSAYKLKDNVLTFDVQPAAGTLIIDPQLDWATYYGDSGSDEGLSVAADLNGFVYLVGQTNSINNIATVGAHQTAIAGSDDGYLVKFNTQGVRQWATYYGGTQFDWTQDVICDASGSVFVAGRTASTTGIATPGSFQPTYNSTTNVYDAFLIKFNGAGVRQWGTYYGDLGGDYAQGLAVDPSGNVYMSGWTNSSTTLATPGAHQTVSAGGNDAFLVKFTTAGARLWGTYYGGNGAEYGAGVVCDNAGNVYMHGQTNSSTTGIATPGSYQPAFAGGGGDAYLVKFDQNGVRQWGTYYGGPGNEWWGSTWWSQGVAYDPAGFLYISGQTSSTTGISTPGVHQPVFGGGTYDVYLAKFNLAGALQWATYYGGPDYEWSASATVAPSGMVFLGGSTYSTTGIATPGSHQPNHSASGTNYDMFLAKFTSAGTRIEGTYFGDVGYDYCGAINHDQYGNIYMAGYTISSMNLATPGAHQTVLGGSDDGILVKWLDDTLVYIQQPFLDTILCKGQVFQVHYGVSYAFRPGNSFTVQLSDATGSFAAPVNIGTALATGGGIINCLVPATIPNGSGYRIRIVASNPSRTSADNGINIRISTTPVVTASSNSPVCVNNPLNLSATSSVTTGVTYSWSGPSFTSNVQNPSIANAQVGASGTYTVTVNNNGCSAQATTTVVVSTGVANPAAGSNSPVCTGGTLNLTASTTSTGATYSWSGPSFTSGVQNPSIANVTAANAGTYTVVISSSAGCQSTVTTNVTIAPNPAAPTAGSNSPVCSGNSINLTASSGATGTTYNWSGPLSFSSTQQNPVRANATTAMSGTYTVTAVIGGCVSLPATTLVVVNQTPGAPIASNNGPLCSGNVLDLFAGGLPGATYQWNGPGGYSSGAQNPSILGATSNNAGNYSVTQTVNGCTSAAGSTTVTVSNTVSPAIAIFPSPNDSICPGQTVVFVASANNGGTGPLYQWKKNGANIPGATNFNYTATGINTGDYFTCELTSNVACPTSAKVLSNNVPMTIIPPQPADVTITASPGLVLSPWETVTFTATPVMGGFLPSYQWYRNGNKVIGATSATWSANNLSSNDTISVVLFSTDACAVPPVDTSNMLVVNIKTGISEVAGTNSLGLYPNPNTGSFTIKGKIMAAGAAIEIVNALGQEVYREQVAVADHQLLHNIYLGEQVANGVYFLKLKTEQETKTIRFTVDR